MAETIVDTAPEIPTAPATSTIVVGYSSKPEGRAALQRAVTEAKLRGSQLQFQYRTEMDESRTHRYSFFVVQPAVTALIRFLPDYRRQTVEVTLRNVDRFESVALEFPATAIDEPVLEDLVRFVLGEANTFLRRAPLAGVGAGRRPAEIKGPEVYRVEKTVRPR